MQRQVGDPGEIANALYNLALAVDFASPEGGTGLTEAVAMLDEAEEIYRRLGDVGRLGDVAWGRGNAYLIDRDFAKAVEPFEASVDYYGRRATSSGGAGGSTSWVSSRSAAATWRPPAGTSTRASRCSPPTTTSRRR